ncbi:MAG: helix-turn-helix transcriptional regulator [bacterium]|nr:helix-turn-helix transcriptional regulator [bacterium]
MASDRRGKNLKQLGEKLRKVREHSGLTQAEVANKADIHVNYYARIERGEENPSFEKLQNIMKALGIKSLDLL